MSNTPLPAGMTFMAWGARVAEDLAAYGVERPTDEADWQSWVCALFYAPELAAANIPGPSGFATWQAWAERFVECMR